MKFNSPKTYGNTNRREKCIQRKTRAERDRQVTQWFCIEVCQTPQNAVLSTTYRPTRHINVSSAKIMSASYVQGVSKNDPLWFFGQNFSITYSTFFDQILRTHTRCDTYSTKIHTVTNFRRLISNNTEYDNIFCQLESQILQQKCSKRSLEILSHISWTFKIYQSGLYFTVHLCEEYALCARGKKN